MKTSLEKMRVGFEDSFVSGADILRNERIGFGPNGSIKLNGDSIQGLAGEVTFNSRENTLAWSMAGNRDGKNQSSLGCQVFVAPFHGLNEVYSLLEQGNDKLINLLARYNVTEKLVAGKPIVLKGQDSIFFKKTPLHPGLLGADLARFNYIDMKSEKSLEPVTIEQKLAVDTGEAVNLSYYLRRGKSTIHLVPNHNDKVYQWANMFELNGFMPAGYATESGIKMDQPYNSYQDHQVTLKVTKSGVEVCAMAHGSVDGKNIRFGVRYMGELVANAPVTVKPRELRKDEDVFALDGDLMNDPSLVGIEFNGSTPENRQTLAIFRIVEDSQTGDMGFVYIKSTDMGIRSGTSVKYSPFLPAKLGEVDETVVYARTDESDEVIKNNEISMEEALYLRMLNHARNLGINTNVEAKKDKKTEHPALLFRR